MYEVGKKKKWLTPKLIVYVRGKPGERVLLACKTGTESIGPGYTATACARLMFCGNSCDAADPS
ncbi:MAG TPA: hypothetical protein VMD04_02380 [Candidatus Margulisiibacteriota bacterium]|nr:hypothetical protein [Candidatus Margulisiibacteriota bacterium]